MAVNIKMVCTGCKKQKESTQFSKGPNKYGLQWQCKQCQSADYRARYKANPNIFGQRQKEQRRKDPVKVQRAALVRTLRHFGKTIQEYDAIVEVQQGKCAICKQLPTGKKSKYLTLPRLSVDHCHTCNTFRGLICYNCNGALGLIRDNVHTLQNMIDYLTRRACHVSTPSMYQ